MHVAGQAGGVRYCLLAVRNVRAKSGFRMKGEVKMDELRILRNFYETVSSGEQDSKTISDTTKELREVLRDIDPDLKCTCVKTKYGPCEVCQMSGNELYTLRNFFRNIRDAKKNNMTEAQIQEFIKNTKVWLKSKLN